MAGLPAGPLEVADAAVGLGDQRPDHVHQFPHVGAQRVDRAYSSALLAGCRSWDSGRTGDAVRPAPAPAL